MKTTGVILAILIYFAVCLSLLSVGWILKRTDPLIIQGLVVLNSIAAAIFAMYTSIRFYKWFNKNTK